MELLCTYSPLVGRIQGTYSTMKIDQALTNGFSYYMGAEILFGGWQAAVRHVGPIRFVGVIHASSPKGNHGSTGMFERHVGRQDPQVGIRNGRKFALDGFQKGAGHLETGIFGVGRFRLEAHAGAIGPTRARSGIVGTAAVPGQANQNGGNGSVIPRWIVH